MFDRYTEKARLALLAAHQNATRLGVAHVEPEHLLLASMIDSNLPQLLTPDSFQELIAKVESSGSTTPSQTQMPHSRALKRALAFAAEESTQFHITPYHLVLGILREGTSFAAQLLERNGMTLEKARAALRDKPAELVLFERLTDKTNRVVFGALQEAYRTSSPMIEPLHFLAGVLAAAQDSPVPFEPPGPHPHHDLPLSLAAQRVLQASGEEADRLQKYEIEPAHILKCVLREDPSLATGIDVAKVEELLQRRKNV